MEYGDALKFLKDLTKFGMNFGLARIQRLLELMGNPERSFKSVHVAGTNGKGSVCSYTSNILACAGYKTGLYTSPHLHSYTERIRINGENIPKFAVAEYITALKPLLLQMVEEGYEHPTEFEVTTALAFKYFADEKVDFAVVEVGLGGAIDSTNVIWPVVSAITNISFDHMDVLGNTITEIAGQKAGIIKKAVPCITAAQGEALNVIKQKCEVLGSQLIIVGNDIAAEEVKENKLGGLDITFIYKEKPFPAITTKLLGDYQVDNAAVALGIVAKLQEMGFGINTEAIRTGFSNTSWPARLEIISEEPLVIIDAAHNHAGAKALVKALQRKLTEKAVFVLGILADKERYNIVSELLPFTHRVIVTKPNSPRAGSWREVYDFIVQQGVKADSEEHIAAAVKKALAYNLPVVITGSIYMVAEARAYLLGITEE